MLSRKDYKMLATVIHDTISVDFNIDVPEGAWLAVQGIVDRLCIELKADNPRFDEAKFRKAALCE